MFAYFTNAGGGTDSLLAGLAESLAAEGRRVAGVIQVDGNAGAALCRMSLRLLDSGALVDISQSLGPGATGCRLDPDALERAVALAGNGIAGADLLIVNRFGRQEAGGRGFRTLIGQALGEGVPVLTALSPRYRAEFDTFADGAAEELAATPAALLDWCRRTLPAAA